MPRSAVGSLLDALRDAFAPDIFQSFRQPGGAGHGLRRNAVQWRVVRVIPNPAFVLEGKNDATRRRKHNRDGARQPPPRNAHWRRFPRHRCRRHICDRLHVPGQPFHLHPLRVSSSSRAPAPQAGVAGAPRLPVRAFRHKATAPAADGQQALANRRSNRLRRQSIARQQHDRRRRCSLYRPTIGVDA